MRASFLFLVLFCSYTLFGQTMIEKVYPAGNIRSVQLDFTYPELVKIVPATGNELKLSASVLINNGENDDNFFIEGETDNGVLKVRSGINDLENLPKRIMISRGDEKIYFNADSPSNPEVRKFLDSSGANYSYMNTGVIKEITIRIEVPRDLRIEVNTKYGLLELSGIQNPGSYSSTYGGVDFTDSGNGLNIIAKTKYGDIFTNLEEAVMPDPLNKPGVGKWISVAATRGSVTAQSNLESKYGNIYLRKNN